MKAFLARIDRRLSIPVLVLAFWAMFWTLNGADEFFNGTSAPNLAVTTGIVHDATGSPLHKIHPLQPIGWYGVSNAPRFVSSFAQLHLGAPVALTVLYALSLAQLALGALFVYLVVRTLRREAATASRSLYGIAFLGSLLVFFAFCMLDILFGDRIQLWQHGTYLALVIITYELWASAERYFTARAVLEPSGPRPGQ